MSKPNRKDYREFVKNYRGILDADRAYLYAATGDRRYKLRRDIFPGLSVEKLPENDTSDSNNLKR